MWQSFVDTHWERPKWTTIFNHWRNSNIQNLKYESSYGIVSFYKDDKIAWLRKFSSLGHCSVDLHYPDKDGRSCLYKDNDFTDSNLHFAHGF